MANGADATTQATRGKGEQTKLILRSLLGALSDEELADIEAQTNVGKGTQIAANIDPQADQIKEFIAGLFAPAGRGIKAAGRGIGTAAKAAGRGIRKGGRAAFTTRGPGGLRRNLFTVAAPGVFGSSFPEADLTPPSPEVQAILDAADQAAAARQ